MTKQAGVYAIVQFRLYVETGEFANVSVVLTSTGHRYIDFRLLRRRGRVTQFFRELDGCVDLDGGDRRLPR